MAGIYIHIPFCKQRCTYCDFYTQVAPDLIPDLIDTIKLELLLRKDYLKNAPIETIYFGGGTPSVLSYSQLNEIFNTIFKLYTVNSNTEITLEANPDDLTSEYLNALSPLPFNRISIGIQSFDDQDLKRINRRHNGIQAIEVVKNCQNKGFKNISIDLIYGLPYQTVEKWEKQLDVAFGLNVQHISVYGLTYEEDTPLWKQRENGEVKPVLEEEMIQMYELLLQKMAQNGFEAYEISNFALPGFRSRHNSAYWKMNPYLGVGPSAHSFDGDSRQWNISSNKKYISTVKSNKKYFTKENLSLNDKYNDYVMVSLRTIEGIHLEYIEKYFGNEYKEYCLKHVEKYVISEKIKITGSFLSFTQQGIHLSNLIISELMFV